MRVVAEVAEQTFVLMAEEAEREKLPIETFVGMILQLGWEASRGRDAG